jgi:uncharacterized protein (DUF1778 family)
MKTHNNVLSARVDDDTYEALQRMAAAVGSSISHYVGELVAAHIRRQQLTPGTSIDDEAIQRFEERLAILESHRQREMETTIKRLESHFTVVKAMIDSLAENSIPEQREAYIKTVQKLIRAAAMQNGGRL